MKHLKALAGLCAMTLPHAVLAQPTDLPIPAATTSDFPAGISVRETEAGAVYAGADGRTLYGMDMRTVTRWTAEPTEYCRRECLDTWEPLLAPDETPDIAYPPGFSRRIRLGLEGREPEPSEPAGDFFADPQKAPDWTVIATPQGPQRVYKGWHLVFARKGDAPGSTMHDGANEFIWNTLKYVPPVPEVEAPGGIAPQFTGDGYVLVDARGRALFTGHCMSDCTGWQPLSGGLASRGVGNWTIDRSGDSPQWAWHGKPVFASGLPDPHDVPESGEPLRP